MRHWSPRRDHWSQTLGAMTKTGTPSAWPFLKESKDQSGKPCIIETRTFTKQCKSKKSGENKKAKELWALKEAKDRGIDLFDASHEEEDETRARVRLDLWAIHLTNPTTASANALGGLEQGEGVPSVASEW